MFPDTPPSENAGDHGGDTDASTSTAESDFFVSDDAAQPAEQAAGDSHEIPSPAREFLRNLLPEGGKWSSHHTIILKVTA